MTAICSKCILNDRYPNLSFDSNGICSICNQNKSFEPIGEPALIKIFGWAKQKNPRYNALIPLSGGKDSTYILHLAVNVYKLNVLTMTYDNGFLTPLALKNIKRAVEITKVEHVFCKPDFNIQRRIYKHMLLKSGDMCGACDIGTKANILKVAKEYSIPIILYGTSPLENDSFVPDSIQDIARFKYIMSSSKEITKKDLREFLIYPNLNQFSHFILKKLGLFAKEISPLFYIDNPSDKEMGEIITQKLGWTDDASKEYSKHFDCVAEPLTNYIRNKIYGYERHICQYSNMVRRNEISREQALELYLSDNINEKPNNFRQILNSLNISETDLAYIEKLKPLTFEPNTSKVDHIFLQLVRLKQKLN